MRDRNLTLWILLTTLLPLFLGADYERWVHGIVLCLMGVAFLAAPPRNRLGRHFGWLAFALFAVSFTAYLPAAWFGNPEWRSIAVDELGIALPATLSPHPWMTLDAVVLFGAGILWTYYLLSQPWHREERLFALRALGGALFALAVLSLLGYAIQWTPPLWQGQNYYGPIANRNQTALLLSLGALLFLGCAYYEFEDRHPVRALAWAAGLPVAFAGLVINGSRAGIILFFAGLGAWVAAVAVQKKSGTILAVAGSILLFLAASFFLFGGDTLKRFETEQSDVVSALKAEARFEIFSETLDIIGNAPVCGIGFANFAPVFALSRDLDDKVSILDRVAQPDNDWLWLASETGLVGLLLAGVLLFLLARRAFPLSGKSRSERRMASLRLAALVGVALFCANGLVNVPGHRMAVVLPGILLLGLAAHGNRRHRASRLLLPGLYRTGAVGALAIGLAWIANAAFGINVPGKSAVEHLSEEAYEAEVAEDFEKARELIDKAIAYEPLRYRHYYKRAVFTVMGGGSCEEALADFALARRLESSHPIIPLGEAEFWLGLRPRFATAPLAEAMRRNPSAAAHQYRLMVLRRDIDPLFKRDLAELAFSDPEFQLIYLFGLVGAEFAAQLNGILEKDPGLDGWTAPQRKRLFAYWRRFGDRETLAAELQSRPDWLKSGWLELAKYHATRNDFSLALEVSKDHLEPPILPRLYDRRSVEDLRTAFALNDTDVNAGLRLYSAESIKDDPVGALAVLEKVTILPDCPDYAFYLLALEREKAGRFQDAWKSLNHYFLKQPPL